MAHDSLLKRLYYDTRSPVCFSGQMALYREARKQAKQITLKDIHTFLHSQKVYTLTKRIQRKFPRNKVVASGFMTDWECDLADMQNISDENDGLKYLFCCIDQLSRYSWVVPLKNKTSGECAKAMEKVLAEGKRPFRLYSDAGGEFMGKFSTLLKKHDIAHIMTKNTETKCSLAERYIRTLKTRLWRAFYTQNHRRYVEILPKIVAAINKTYHNTIKRAPNTVNRENAKEVRQMLYGKQKCSVKVKGNYKVGDTVRISNLRHPFAKGYKGSFTKELFTVMERIPRKPPVYVLHDLANDRVQGTFYENEMVKVLNHNKIYEINEELRKRTRNGVKEILVSWDGYPKKFNSWLLASDVANA